MNLSWKTELLSPITHIYLQGKEIGYLKGMKRPRGKINNYKIRFITRGLFRRFINIYDRLTKERVGIIQFNFCKTAAKITYKDTNARLYSRGLFFKTWVLKIEGTDKVILKNYSWHRQGKIELTEEKEEVMALCSLVARNAFLENIILTILFSAALAYFFLI
jgi:hypothetical protein